VAKDLIKSGKKLLRRN